MIRVVLPYHLRTLAQVDGEVSLEVDGPVTQSSVLGALEARYPMLRGAIRDHVTHKRRPFLRFFACDARPVSRAARFAVTGCRRFRRRAAADCRGDCRRISSVGRPSPFLLASFRLIAVAANVDHNGARQNENLVFTVGDIDAIAVRPGKIRLRDRRDHLAAPPEFIFIIK